MRILITEPISGPQIDWLGHKYEVVLDAELWADRKRLLEMIWEFDALIVRSQTQIDAELIERAHRLKVIGRTGVGLDNIDMEAANRHGVVVSYSPTENTITVAEFTIGLIIALLRKIVIADRSVRSGRWDRLAHTGVELYGKTLGILGLGRIGSRVACLAEAFQMRVLAFDPYVKPDHPLVRSGRVKLTSLDDLLVASDIVTIHVPLTKETERLIDDAALRKMRRDAILVNVARGPIVDEQALYLALVEGRIAGAALDVRQKEPPAPSPLDTLDNVILTPHIGGLTYEALERVYSAVATDVDRVLSGQEAINFANFPRPLRT